jgi:4-carboxymuconolactone decarboxylase
LSETIVAAVAAGRRPDTRSSDETIVYNFTTELLRLQKVSDAAFTNARERFGENGVIDMVGVAGYYSFLSMMMNTAQTAVPTDSDVLPLP